MFDYGEWLIQALKQKGIVIGVPAYHASDKKGTIRVLHVDDDSSILEISKQILSNIDERFSFDQAHCVDEAFKKIATEQYDIIISDYALPQKNGLQFLEELRKQNNGIPFILFTGKGREEVAIKALNLGADGYVNKQGNPETVYGELFHLTDQILKRKQAELSHIESEAKYRNIFNNSGIGMFRSKLDGSEILDFNEKYLNIFGLTREEMQGKRSVSFWANPLEREEMVCLLKVEGFVKDFECKMLNKQGEMRHCLTSVKLYPEQGILEGSILDVTERKKAEEHRKVLERKVNDYSKHLKCMVDLRTAQLKDANERLVKSERLAAIGELAGMVGHDLRNPLAGIRNATYFLKKKGKAISEAQAKEMLEIIDNAIGHSDKIINDLLDYSREMHLELTESTLPTLLNAAMRMVQVPDRIQILNHVYEETKIIVDTDKILRVFVNLIKNAIDAMPEQGTLEISSCQKKGCVKVVFADTGKGISEETLPKIFMPLFTTKAQGMGFGLAICKRIIDAHGGTITVKTAAKKGTTFTILLPTNPKVQILENQLILENQNAN